ncbi:MAG: hypothetical protein DWQ08_06030 [Proteobacteria bacterium]|nr:MAG: hypothetical protein DWQ08_06030 [Pseudomonadota bacterium]
MNIDSIPIVVVHLARAGRRARIEGALSELGLIDNAVFVDAVDGAEIGDADMRRHASAIGYLGHRLHRDRVTYGTLTRGAVACALSWKSVLSGIDEPTLVLEDDAVFCDGFRHKFDTAVSRLPADWQMAYVSCNPYGIWMGPEIDSCVLRVQKRIHGTGALLLHPQAVPLLLSLFPLDLQFDHDIPDRLIATGRLCAYRLTYHGEALITNDNFGGSFTQAADC